MTGAHYPAQRNSPIRPVLLGLVALLALVFLRPGDGLAATTGRAGPLIGESSVVTLAFPVARPDRAADPAGWAEIARGWASRARFAQRCVTFDSADAAGRTRDSASDARAQGGGQGFVLSNSGPDALVELPRHRIRFAEGAAAASLAHPVPLLPPPRIW